MDAEGHKSPPHNSAGPQVLGKLLDDQTRCVHYHSLLDVIAIRFKCCGSYFPCFECHEETADHPARPWLRSEWNTPAILCGVCRHELTIEEYMSANHQCPNCKAAFNPGCARHYHLYFSVD